MDKFSLLYPQIVTTKVSINCNHQKKRRRNKQKIKEEKKVNHMWTYYLKLISSDIVAEVPNSSSAHWKETKANNNLNPLLVGMQNIGNRSTLKVW